MSAQLYVQYPDLTEVVGAYVFADPADKSGWGYGSSSKSGEDTVKRIQTEFAFLVATPEDAKRYNPDMYGFKTIAVMNNWYPGHLWHKRALQLYFWIRPKDNPLPAQPPKISRYGWLAQDIVREKYGPFDFTHAPRDTKGAIKYTDEELRKDLLNHKTNKWISAGGCGFKLAIPPLRRDDFARYFTLLRMPVEVTKRQKLWLDNFNFRKIASGTEASYWANGWKPDEYSEAKEEEFFISKGIITDPSKACKTPRPIVPWQYRDSGLGGLRVREGLDLREPSSGPSESEIYRVSHILRPRVRRTKLLVGPKVRRKRLTRKVKPIVDSVGLHNKRTLAQAPSAVVSVEKFVMPENKGQVGDYDMYARKKAQDQRAKRANKK